MTASSSAASGDVLRRILAVVSTRRPGGGVTVTGEGKLAEGLRLSLAIDIEPPRHGGGPGATAPACIVDTTGDPEVIAQAVTRLGNLGLLVLAGPPSPLSLDLYPDVHVRGLRLVGVEASAAPDPARS